MNLLFKLVWWHWFKDYKVIRIKGWCTAVVDSKFGQRMIVSPVFSWEKEHSYSLSDKYETK